MASNTLSPIIGPTSFEYDHVSLDGVTVPLPAVMVVNTQNVGVRQSIDIFKLGVNYKLDWRALMVAKN